MRGGMTKALILLAQEAYAALLLAATIGVLATPVILALSATASHAALNQPRPDTDSRPKPIVVYEAPKACNAAKRKFITLKVKKLINDRLVDVAVAIVPVEC